MHTWIGELQSSAVRLTVAAGSEEAGRTEVQAAGRRTEVPRGKRMRSPGGYEMPVLRSDLCPPGRCEMV